MIGFLLYFATAVGIVFPVGLSVIDGKIPWASVFTPQFLGPPGLLGIAAFFAVFTPRFAGCLAFAGCASCWIYSGSNVVQSVIALISPQNLDTLAKMNNEALLNYGLGWLPTLGLILTTIYSLYRALKLPNHLRARREDEITVGTPPPEGAH